MLKTLLTESSRVFCYQIVIRHAMSAVVDIAQICHPAVVARWSGTEGLKMKFCEKDYCLNAKCISSDSGMKVRKCWCAECKDYRKEIKQNAYRITIVKAGA